jgi:hypothetical protein
MASAGFDTHRIVKRLKEAGFDDLQAEAVTDVLKETRDHDLKETRDHDFARVATKAGLEPLASKSDLAALETRQIKRLVPLLLGQAALIATLVRLL